MGKIEVKVTKYFAGIGYDGYSAKFLDGGTINIRISKNVLKDPKTKKNMVILKLGDYLW